MIAEIVQPPRLIGVALRGQIHRPLGGADGGVEIGGVAAQREARAEVLAEIVQIHRLTGVALRGQIHRLLGGADGGVEIGRCAAQREARAEAIAEIVQPSPGLSAWPSGVRSTACSAALTAASRSAGAPRSAKRALRRLPRLFSRPGLSAWPSGVRSTACSAAADGGVEIGGVAAQREAVAEMIAEIVQPSPAYRRGPPGSDPPPARRR